MFKVVLENLSFDMGLDFGLKGFNNKNGHTKYYKILLDHVN